MALDPNIALGVRPMEVPNALAQYGQIAQLQNYQNQNALAQYQLSSAQRADATENALSAAYKNAYDPTNGNIDVTKLRASLASGGFGSKLPAVEESLLKLDKTRTEADKAKTDLVDAKLKQSRSYLDTINPNDPNAPAQYIAWHEANHRDPVLGPALSARGVTAEQSRARIMDAINKGPAAFAQLLDQSKLGAEKFMELNKPHWVDAGSQQTAVSGLTGKPLTNVPAIPKTATPGELMTNTRENKRIALAEEDARLKREGIEGISPKEMQKREASFPQATSTVKGFENKSDAFINDLEKLRNHPGLSQITGILAGRVSGVTSEGRSAQALYDKVVAKGGFQALQDLRDASKTGGALGNVSNQEGKQLTASFAAIDRRQNAKDVQASIDEAIGNIEGAKTRMREAYDTTYSYKNKQGESGKPAASAAPATAKPTVSNW